MDRTYLVTNMANYFILFAYKIVRNLTVVYFLEFLWKRKKTTTSRNQNKHYKLWTFTLFLYIFSKKSCKNSLLSFPTAWYTRSLGEFSKPHILKIFCTNRQTLRQTHITTLNTRVSQNFPPNKFWRNRNK